MRDLRVYAAKLRGTVYHYRDKTGLEADAVVVLDDGRWGACLLYTSWEHQRMLSMKFFTPLGSF